MKRKDGMGQKMFHSQATDCYMQHITNSNCNYKNHAQLHLHDGFKLHVKLLFYRKGMLSLLIMDVSGLIFSFRNAIFIKIDAFAI